MPTFKRRPSFVDAVQYTDILHPPRGVRTTSVGTPVVDTANGSVMKVYLMEWICADPDGKHYYPMSDELFCKLFEPVDQEVTPWPLGRPKPNLKLVEAGE